MAEIAIRLDRSKNYSECRGERTPDDPHYKVHYFQTFDFRKKKIQLPFDAAGILVPDDGRTAAYAGVADGKPVEHHPLYTEDMRALVEQLKKRKSVPKADLADDDEGAGEPEIPGTGNDAGSDVNLESWLRGEVKYPFFLLRAAVTARYHRNCNNLATIVVELVQEEKLIPEDQVCEALRQHLLK